MKYYDMVTIPDLGSKAVFESIKNAEDKVLKEEYKRSRWDWTSTIIVILKIM